MKEVDGDETTVASSRIRGVEIVKTAGKIRIPANRSTVQLRAYGTIDISWRPRRLFVTSANVAISLAAITFAG